MYSNRHRFVWQPDPYRSSPACLAVGSDHATHAEITAAVESNSCVCVIDRDLHTLGTLFWHVFIVKPLAHRGPVHVVDPSERVCSCGAPACRMVDAVREILDEIEDCLEDEVEAADERAFEVEFEEWLEAARAEEAAETGRLQ